MKIKIINIALVGLVIIAGFSQVSSRNLDTNILNDSPEDNQKIIITANNDKLIVSKIDFISDFNEGDGIIIKDSERTSNNYEIYEPEFDEESNANEPAVYVKDDKLKVEVKFKFTSGKSVSKRPFLKFMEPSFKFFENNPLVYGLLLRINSLLSKKQSNEKIVSNQITTYKIKATGDFPIEEKYVVFTNDESDWITFESIGEIPNKIKTHQITWNWQYKEETDTTWNDFDSTSHTIYAINKAPLTLRDHNEIYVWKKLVDWTTNWCEEIPVEDQGNGKIIADTILEGFVEDEVIRYGSFGTAGSRVETVLISGSGMCNQMSDVFLHACNAQGILATRLLFELVSNGLHYVSPRLVIFNSGLGNDNLPANLRLRLLKKISVFPNPNYFGLDSPIDDVEIEISRPWYFPCPQDSHCANLLEFEDGIYLYDLSFGCKSTGPVFNEMPVESEGHNPYTSEMTMFRQNYFDENVDFVDAYICHTDINGDIIEPIYHHNNFDGLFAIPPNLIPYDILSFYIEYLY